MTLRSGYTEGMVDSWFSEGKALEGDIDTEQSAAHGRGVVMVEGYLEGFRHDCWPSMSTLVVTHLVFLQFFLYSLPSQHRTDDSNSPLEVNAALALGPFLPPPS